MGTILGEPGWEVMEPNKFEKDWYRTRRLCPPTLVTFRSLEGFEKEIVDCLSSITHGLWVMCRFPWLRSVLSKRGNLTGSKTSKQVSLGGSFQTSCASVR